MEVVLFFPAKKIAKKMQKELLELLNFGNRL